MDFYDVFKTLTKGIKFKSRVIGISQKKQIARQIQSVKPEIPDGRKTSADFDSYKNEKAPIKSEHDSVLEKNDRLEIMKGMSIAEDELSIKRNSKKKAKLNSEAKQKQKEQEEHNRFRNLHGIRVSGRRVPPALADFETLITEYGISDLLFRNLQKCGYVEPTPIQRQALTCLLQNRDVMASAPTGSGKTIAFLLPVLNSLIVEKGSLGAPRGLILCPTRELAQQTHTEALRLSDGTGMVCTLLNKSVIKKMNEKKSELKMTDLLISTPSRLCHLFQMDNSPIKFNKIKWLVIDEADRLVEGSAEHSADFHHQLNTALTSCTLETTDGDRRHMALLSATHTPILAKLARKHTHKLISITVGHRNTAATTVDQKLTYCGSESGKLLEFRQLVRKGIQPPVLVFVQSKERAKQLFKELLYDGINVDVIHADRTQQQRDNVVRSFRCGGVWVLICTELMARGLDFRGVNLVINYDMPPSAISYIHRVGRAGRAGRKGEAITFFTDDDVPNLRSIAVVMKESGCEVPEFLLGLKKQSTDQKKKLIYKPPDRDNITTAISKKRKALTQNTDDKKRTKTEINPNSEAKEINGKETRRKKITKIKNPEKKGGVTNGGVSKKQDKKLRNKFIKNSNSINNKNLT